MPRLVPHQTDQTVSQAATDDEGVTKIIDTLFGGEGFILVTKYRGNTWGPCPIEIAAKMEEGQTLTQSDTVHGAIDLEAGHPKRKHQSPPFIWSPLQFV